MDGWTTLLGDAHQAHMEEVDGEVDEEYREWNRLWTETGDRQALWNMTQRCYEEVTDGLKIKDLMDDLAAAIEEGQ